MSERPHRRLTKCHVLFLGDSTPEQSSEGLRSLQQPLMTCYPVDKPSEVEGIDSWITIFTSGILLQFVGDKGDEKPLPIWFPIQNLHIAAATKCVNYIDPNTGQRMETEFVDINNEIAEKSSHPPLFSIIVRKTSGKRVLRCYTFLVRDEAPAVAMVDAAKHAFTHKSGWSSNHPPPGVIQNELVPGAADDTDEIDEFDSVSTAGRRGNKDQNSPQQMNDADEQSAHGSKASRAFPSHLVRKYTLTNTNRGYTSPLRRPIPPEFMYQSSHSSTRAAHYGRSAPPIPPYMMNGGQAYLAGLEGSLRATSSVRVITDPRTRTPVIERVIREPVPVPVYQPPPPPQVIREPVFVPQPPEIRHIPVEKHVPVPVEVPVPYPMKPEQRYFEEEQRHRRRSEKRSRKKSHNTFKNYQIYDERFVRHDETRRQSFFVNSSQPYNAYPQTNGYTPSRRESYHHAAPHQRRSHGRRRNSRSSSSGDSSDDDQRGYRGPWERASPYRNGVEITELPSPNERNGNIQPDVNGNHKGRYSIRQLEDKLRDYGLTDKKQGGKESPRDFQWTAMPSAKPSKEERRSERRSRKEKPDTVVNSPDYDRGQVYVGADPVKTVKPSHDTNNSSFQKYRLSNQPHPDEHQEKKKKDKKKRDKTPSRYESEAAPNQASTSKEYYFKEATSKAPRNWMDEQKEYMNERAFSSSLAKDLDAEVTDAYALNTSPSGDDMFHRAMPAPMPSNGIPVPPPFPDHLKLNIGGAKAADLY